jgi:hypothetical protein
VGFTLSDKACYHQGEYLSISAAVRSLVMEAIRKE